MWQEGDHATLGRYVSPIDMTIGRLSWPNGLLVGVAALLIWQQQSRAQVAEPPVLLFLGSHAQEMDPTFANFSAALARQWHRTQPGPVVRYARASSDAKDLGRSLVAAVAKHKPSVMVLPSGSAAKTARDIGLVAPIVFSTYPDPRRLGLSDTLRQPGRASTGIWLGDSLDLKRLEMLRLAFPGISEVSMLMDRSWMSTRNVHGMVEDARRELGLTVVVRIADSVEELNEVLSRSAATPSDAWYIPPTYIAYLAEAEIIAHLKRLKKPAIHSTTQEVAQGALMAYSPETGFVYDALAQLTRRVALGEDAGTIPVQRPYRFTLSVRIEPDAPWARIDPSVIRRADRVFQPR
jgi:putative tryptophan/tyrosine transport system substrate-binding protein